MRSLLAVALLFATTSSFAIEDLTVEVTAWLLNHSTTNADKAWEAKLEGKIKDKIATSDSISGDEAAATLICYDWAADRRKKFDESNPNRPPLTLEDKQSLCRIYAYFMKKGWQFPQDVRDDLTKAKFLVWIGK